MPITSISNFDGALVRNPPRNCCPVDLRTTTMISENKTPHQTSESVERQNSGPSGPQAQYRQQSRRWVTLAHTGQCLGCRAASRLVRVAAAVRQWEQPELRFWLPSCVLYAWCSSSACRDRQRARRAHQGCAHAVSRIGTAR